MDPSPTSGGAVLVPTSEYRRLLRDVRISQDGLAEAQNRFQRLVETIPGVAHIAEPGEDGVWQYISPRLVELLGYEPHEWLSDPTAWIGLIHPDDRERVLMDEGQWIERTGGVHVGEYRILARSGEFRWVRDAATARPGQGPDDKALWFGVLSDVTESREAQAAAVRSEQLLRSVLETAQDAFVALDADGAVIEWNRRAELVFDRSRGDAVGCDLVALITPPQLRPADATHLRELLAAGSQDEAATRRELTAVRADGTAFPAEVTIWSTGVAQTLRHNAFIRDITERTQLRDELRALAFHDELTGLANRVSFCEHLERALTGGRPDRSKVAVLFLDLDDFKTVNDSLGHPAGDEVLRVVAGRLHALVRPTDTVARFGGDEFAILLRGIRGQEEAMATARRVSEVLRDPFLLHGRRTVVSVSIGVALPATPEAASVTAVLRDADAAMYQAKRSGKNICVVYDPVMHVQALARLDLKTDLETAVLHDELVLAFQPYFALAGEELVGFEALVRWQHPARGLVSPTQFIPLAEETGLIHRIGEWVLRAACEHAAGWEVGRSGRPPATVSVNVSAVQFQDPDLVSTVSAALRDSGLDPHRLVIEITEGVLLHQVDHVVTRLHELRAMGVRIAIDDFGTGYSSLSYLQHLPIDVLKIDKSFVNQLGLGADGSSMVKVIVQIARPLGLQVVAEGVERPEQQEALRRLGCDLVQGYLLARPLAAGEAAAASARPRRL